MPAENFSVEFQLRGSENDGGRVATGNTRTREHDSLPHDELGPLLRVVGRLLIEPDSEARALSAVALGAYVGQRVACVTPYLPRIITVLRAVARADEPDAAAAAADALSRIYGAMKNLKERIKRTHAN